MIPTKCSKILFYRIFMRKIGAHFCAICSLPRFRDSHMTHHCPGSSIPEDDVVTNSILEMVSRLDRSTPAPLVFRSPLRQTPGPAILPLGINGYDGGRTTVHDSVSSFLGDSPNPHFSWPGVWGLTAPVGDGAKPRDEKAPTVVSCGGGRLLVVPGLGLFTSWSGWRTQPHP